MKNPWDTLRQALRVNGVVIENVRFFPFMLRLSKHSESFFSTLIAVRFKFSGDCAEID
jgi:hypothetical protein